MVQVWRCFGWAGEASGGGAQPATSLKLMAEWRPCWAG
jgi:hypothetical protein